MWQAEEKINHLMANLVRLQKHYLLWTLVCTQRSSCAYATDQFIRKPPTCQINNVLQPCKDAFDLPHEKNISQYTVIENGKTGYYIILHMIKPL